MDINITRFFETAETHDFSNSVANTGLTDIGKITWLNAKDEAQRTPLLTTEDELDAMRAFARASGGWDQDEVAAWSADEVNALFIQWISGDMNEMGDLFTDDDGEIDWEAVEEAQQQGRIASNIYRADDGSIWFTLDC